MSTFSPSIEFMMIRDDKDSADDVICIKKDLETNEFVVTFTDPNEGDPVVYKMSGLYHQKVLDYVYYLMKNQYLDEEGFDRVQVNMPAMPRMIVDGEKFKDLYYRDHFYELIGFGLDNLENTEKVVTTPKRPVAVRPPTAPAAPARFCGAKSLRCATMNPEECCASLPYSYPRNHLFFDEE